MVLLVVEAGSFLPCELLGKGEHLLDEATQASSIPLAENKM
jgi:hypothetical protein